MKRLERDPFLELKVFRLKHGTHAALSDVANNPKAPGDNIGN